MMQNDDDYFDDDMAFDDGDDFDALDDFDDGVELEGGFDDGDDFAPLEDEYDAGDADEVDPKLLMDNKESFLSKFSFNQIVIGATLLVGVGIFLFQVMTTKPAVQQEQFRSSVNMSGANDNIVFNDTQVPVTPQNVTVEEKVDPNTQGLLNNPDALDSLEIDFDTQLPMPTPIAPKELNDEAILLQKNFPQNQGLQGNADVVVADEFTNAPKVEVTQDGFGDPAGFGDTTMVASQAIDTPPADMTVIKPDVEIDLNPNNQGAKKLAELPSAPKVVVDADNFNITSPVDIEAPKVEIPEIVAVAPKVVVEPKPETIVEKPVLPLSEAKSVAAPDNANQLAQEQVSKIEDLKNQEILALKQTVEELEKEIAALKKQKAKPAVVKKAAKKVTKKAAPKKRAPVVKRASSQWELRAAQPGKAWVSKKGQSELQPVMVGDNLDGIGRIQSITYQKNQWIVTGSSGSIKQ